jgi:hypothetical protein
MNGKQRIYEEIKGQVKPVLSNPGATLREQ